MKCSKCLLLILLFVTDFMGRHAWRLVYNAKLFWFFLMIPLSWIHERHERSRVLLGTLKMLPILYLIKCHMFACSCKTALQEGVGIFVKDLTVQNMNLFWYTYSFRLIIQDEMDKHTKNNTNAKTTLKIVAKHAGLPAPPRRLTSCWTEWTSWTCWRCSPSTCRCSWPRPPPPSSLTTNSPLPGATTTFYRQQSRPRQQRYFSLW